MVGVNGLRFEQTGNTLRSEPQGQQNNKSISGSSTTHGCQTQQKDNKSIIPPGMELPLGTYRKGHIWLVAT